MPDAPVAPQQASTTPTNPVNMPALAQQPIQRTNELAMAALILGILGFVWILPIIGSILAIIFGAIALSQIKQGKGTGKGMAYAGLWLGITSLVLAVLAGIVIIAAIPALQRNARSTADTAKKVVLNAVVVQLEEYHAEKGYYPAKLSDIASTNMREAYTYVPTPSGCVGTAEAIIASPNAPLCTDFTIKVVLNDGSEYVRENIKAKSKTLPIPSVNKTQSTSPQTD